jgi:hypothetical protein
MRHGSAVAGLAGKIAVKAGPFHGIDIVVTLGANLGTRVFRLFRNLFFNGGGTMKTRFLEPRGDDILPNDDHAPD